MPPNSSFYTGRCVSNRLYWYRFLVLQMEYSYFYFSKGSPNLGRGALGAPQAPPLVLGNVFSFLHENESDQSTFSCAKSWKWFSSWRSSKSFSELRRIFNKSLLGFFKNMVVKLSQSLNLPLSLRDRDRADTIITLYHTTENFFKPYSFPLRKNRVN